MFKDIIEIQLQIYKFVQFWWQMQSLNVVFSAYKLWYNNFVSLCHIFYDQTADIS